MRLGREATAARRQASRLAGLVRLPAGWPIQTAIRRQASWLATKASVDLKSRWPFARQKYPSYQKTSQPARVKPAPRQLRGKENQPIYPRRKTFRPQRSIPTCKGGACQPPTAGEQSGDRQRREKALPFLKEEKSEHERARTSMLTVQPCCARHCELPLSKMGSKGLFPVVAVPLAFFCTLFFRHRKKSVNAP